jgi:hypothetical protein
MADSFPPRRPGRLAWALGFLLVVLGAAGAAGYYFLSDRSHPPPAGGEGVTAAATEQVRSFCSSCHAYPPPDSFPRASWEHEVKQGFDFYNRAAPEFQARWPAPPQEAVLRYYEERAPDQLPPIPRRKANGPPPVLFRPVELTGPAVSPHLAVSHVQLAPLSDERRPDLLVTDMRSGYVLAARPSQESPRWRVLGRVPNPAHVEVVDLDKDGVPDLLVNFTPTDDRYGSDDFLRGGPGERFSSSTLLANVGRVADVRAADFDGDGDLDLVVAEFGWRNVGKVLWLENRTTDWSRPRFVPHELDPRHGAIHVPVADLNKDGKPDFVALISQEHETVVAFLNAGGGQFRRETVYAAPHPGYGSSGIELVDLDKDGDLDVLYTNGDVLDHSLLKPYHGIRWLENRGRYPFVEHHLAAMYGVHRAVAADFDGDGDLDVVAVSFLPAERFPARGELGLESVLLLEQASRGRFAPHTLQAGKNDCVACAAGDLYGDGKMHLVTGIFSLPGDGTVKHPVTIWKNLGRPPSRR